MDNMEFLKKLMWVQDDHLRDAQCFLDYAVEFKYQGNEEAMRYFVDTAKHRLDHYDELCKKTTNMLQAMPKAADDTRDCVCWEILEKKTKHWVDKMKSQIANWNS